MNLSPITTIVFNQPSVLPFLGLILIPIIVHLFNLRRTKKVVFSNTALLKKVKEETSSKRKPKELLILLSRILGVLFIVLGFAQPTIKNDSTAVDSPDDVIIYVDNAPAMKNVNEGESRISEAIRYAQNVLDAYPDGTKFHFVENSYQNSILTDYTKQTLGELLAETDVVGVGRELSEILNRIEASGLSGDVYLISDFQGYPQSLQFDSLQDYYLSQVENDLSNNLFVDTVYLENSFLSGSFSNQLNINVRSNNNDAVSASVRVYFGESLSGTLSIDVEGAGNGLFEIPENQKALDQIRLELEDESVLFDNLFYLSINSLQLTNVVEVFDNSSTSFISELFTDNEYFNFGRTATKNLDNQLIEGGDIIIVNGVQEFSNQLINRLREALNTGANVTIIPSNDFSTSTLLDLGIRLSSDDDQEVGLESPDFSNPFFQGVFEEENVNMQMPYASTSYRLLNPEYDLLRFLNGRSFFSKVAVDGNLFVFTSPFEGAKTSFTNHALFVPVFYRLALGSQRNFANLYYYTDSETVSFPLRVSQGSAVYEIVGDELTLTPDQRSNKGQLIMTFPKDEVLPGSYEVQTAGQSLGFISLNQSQDESFFNSNIEEYLSNLAQADNIQIIGAANANEFGTLLQARLVGTSLWKWALALGLLFLFVEIILIRYL